eukprot:5308120-Prorocentrum_lima.AAC.1
MCIRDRFIVVGAEGRRTLTLSYDRGQWDLIAYRVVLPARQIMHAHTALWHDYDAEGFPEWAPKSLRGDILLIGGHRPWEQNSHEIARGAEEPIPVPPEKRARAAVCYMMATEEVE